MTEAAKKKLGETLFFLRLLINHREHIMGGEPHAFLYYLSAFLSAGRSVTFALQAEEKTKYDAWFPSWYSNNCTEEERELLKSMNDQRVEEVKKRGATIRVEMEAIPMVELRRADIERQHPAYGFQWFSPPQVLGFPGSPEAKRPMHYFQLGKNKADVIATCKRYVKLLDRLVQEFVAAHEQ
jgi:hypothetical protein